MLNISATTRLIDAIDAADRWRRDQRGRGPLGTLRGSKPRTEEPVVAEFSSHPPGTPSWFDLSTADLTGAKAHSCALFGRDVTDGGPGTGGCCILLKGGMFLKGGTTVAGVGPRQMEGMAPAWPTS